MKETFYPRLDERLFRETLSNGLTVLVCPRPGFARKCAYFVTNYGAIHTSFLLDGKAYEAPAGIAHYLEHKMFDMPDGDVSAAFAALGANVNAFTSYDMTAYYFTCTENFMECLSLLLKFVSTPCFTNESVEKERGIINQEISMNDDDSGTRVFENLMKAMYRRHPINTPILGTRETIADITPELLFACHKAFYDPRNMLLCVVGDVEPERIVQTAAEILPMEAGTEVSCVRAWEEDMTCGGSYVRAEMEVAMPLFQLGFKCEPVDRGEAAARQEIVGDLAAEALFGESSELYLKLYEQGLIDSSFGGGFETVEGCAMLTCSGDSNAPDKVRDAILAQAERLARQGVAQADFDRMKRSAMGRRIRDLDSFDATCFRLCAYEIAQFDYFRFPQMYQAVEKEEVQAFLDRVVRRERCALSVIFPNQEVSA